MVARDASSETETPTASLAPMDVSEEEIGELAGPRPKSSPVVERLKAHRPAETTGRPVVDKASPAPISSKDMAAIRKAGQPAAKVRARFTVSDAPADPLGEQAEAGSAPERTRKTAERRRDHALKLRCSIQSDRVGRSGFYRSGNGL